jgi:hypothetical protein
MDSVPAAAPDPPTAVLQVTVLPPGHPQNPTGREFIAVGQAELPGRPQLSLDQIRQYLNKAADVIFVQLMRNTLLRQLRQDLGVREGAAVKDGGPLITIPGMEIPPDVRR